MPHSALSYARLKASAALLRFLSSWVISNEANPDETFYITSRHGTRKIKVHVYKSASPRQGQPTPVLINWHGSGFVLPMHGSDDMYCRKIAEDTDYTVLDATYALAPEYPFPSALEDVEDVIMYVLGKPDVYDQSSISLSGFSAGGNLALVAASNPNGPVPKGAIQSVMAIYPVVDFTIPASQKSAPDGSSGTLPHFVLSYFSACYLTSEFSSNDPRISVTKANIDDFPAHILIVTAEKDNLAPEAEALVAKLKADRRKRVYHKRAKGMHHGYDKNAKEGSLEMEKRDKLYKLAVTFLWTTDEDG